MKLKRITIIDHLTGWNVKDLVFDTYLTLLVGASGVGKTLILRAIKNISNIANGSSINGLEWDVTFEDSGNTYQWTGKFSKANDNSNYFKRDTQEYPIIFESLRCGDHLIIQRKSDQILLNDQQTVKLDTAKSAIALLKEEDEIKPVFNAFHQIFELVNYNDGIRISPFLSFKKRDEIKELSDIHNSRFLSPIEKLFILRKQRLPQFERIKELFIDIFKNIENIDFSLEQLFDDTMYPVLKIKERGVGAWIMQNSISSGMFRTLSQITFLVLAQDGDIILIDEFENGLGVNCIDQLADQILDADQNIQVIITSHHPYIINSIPFEKWKVVTRNRCNLKVLTADDLKIGKHSKHDAFMQLIQTNAYRMGVE